MEGDCLNHLDEDFSSENDSNVGIIPRSIDQLFSELKSIANCEYSVKVSFVELYCNEIIDLQGNNSLKIKKILKFRKMFFTISRFRAL
jgi:translation initiation factor 1 (eIF-1/SUI1)